MTDLPPPPPAEDDEDALAAEYVLRLLDPAEEAACAARIAGDPAFAALVADWQAAFAGLDAAFAPVAPPADLRGRVEAALFGRAPSRLARLWVRLWDSARFWRGATAAALIAVAAVAVIGPGGLLQPPPEVPAARLVAAVQPVRGDVTLMALHLPGAATIEFSRVAGSAPAGRDLELWLLPPGAAVPASLGVVPATERFATTLPPDLAAQLGPGTAILVSDEPAGGSPTGLPTGAVVASGEIRQI